MNDLNYPLYITQPFAMSRRSRSQPMAAGPCRIQNPSHGTTTMLDIPVRQILIASTFAQLAGAQAIVSLGPKAGAAADPLSAISGIGALPDGRVVVSDDRDKV